MSSQTPVRGPFKSLRIVKIDVDSARIRYERGDNLAEIAAEHGVTTHGIMYRAGQLGWRRPKAVWRPAARQMYEQGVTCVRIGEAVGVATATVEAVAAQDGWVRKAAPVCSRCGVELALSKKGGSAGKRVCQACTKERYRQKSLARWASMSAEERREERRRIAEKSKGRPLYTREQLGARWEEQRRNAPRRQRPSVQLGRFRHYGEMPTTREGALAVLQATLTKLLAVKCEEEGLNRDSVEYRAKYNIDPEFRERERLRTSGKRWGNRLGDGKDDGTLTQETVRRLFARAKKCPYCWQPMKSQDKSLDHMQPLSRGGDHSIGNVLVCCLRCNSKKHDTPYDVWLTKIPAPCERALRERAA